VAANRKNQLLQLGEHHSSKPPGLENLPFNFNQTSKFQIPIPDFVDGYRELELINYLNLGSHTLLVGKVIFQLKGNYSTKSLFHQHIALAIKRGNQYEII
jgi:hypothetical protein